jgi:hypothetical protein
VADEYGGSSLTVVKWAAPSAELAKKVLAAGEDGRYPESGSKRFMTEAWGRRCQGMLFRNCKPQIGNVPRATICFVANMHLCGTPKGRNLMRFVRALTSALCWKTGVLAKGTEGRKHFNVATAVLRVFRKHRVETLRPKDRVLHLRYGNLASGLFFFCKRLESFEGTLYGDKLESIVLERSGPLFTSGVPSSTWIWRKTTTVSYG